MDFKAPQESKAASAKCHRFGRHSERTSLQYQANFHRSQVWQIVPISNSVWLSDNCLIYGQIVAMCWAVMLTHTLGVAVMLNHVNYMLQNGWWSNPEVYGKTWQYRTIRKKSKVCRQVYVDGFEQDCNNSSVLGMELLLSCTKPVMCSCLSEHIGFPSSDLVNTGLAETLLKF